MSVYKRGNVYWYEFTFRGQRIRESTNTGDFHEASAKERNRKAELEANASRPAESGTVQAKLEEYLRHFDINHRQSTVNVVRLIADRLTKRLGHYQVRSLTETVMKNYIRARLDEGVGGRAINLEVGTLSRAIGRTWKELWPGIRHLEENRDVGRALSEEEEARLVEAARQSESPHTWLLVKLALLTGMRVGEIRTLTWSQVDLQGEMIRVGKAKTDAGRREIPMNSELLEILRAQWASHKELFGCVDPHHCVFPGSVGGVLTPRKPLVEFKTAWNKVRQKSGVSCRFHDLRHTAATKMSEAGVPDGVLMEVLGHISPAMLRRYSHPRKKARREAMKALESR